MTDHPDGYDPRQALTEALLAICDQHVKYAYESATGEVEALLAWPPGALSRDAAKAVPHTIGDIITAVLPVLAARDAEVARLQAVLDDLRDRTVRADEELQRLAPRGAAPEYRRLQAKAEGVRLALSYLNEAIREARNTPPMPDPTPETEPHTQGRHHTKV